jgi:hypothetical protein
MMKNFIRKTLMSLALCVAVVSVAYATGGNELAYFKIPQLTALAITDVNPAADYVPVYDASAEKVKKVLASALNGNSNVETVITTNVIASTECGKTFFLDLAGGFTSTLPAPVAGCKFKFIAVTAPTTAYIVASNAGADIIHITVNELETDTGDDGPWDDNADAVSFAANVAATGDFLECVSDGTGWYCDGQSKLDGGFTSSTT